MAEAVATFALEEILKKVISLAAQEINLVWGFKQDLKTLGDSLLFIQALLHDAGEKQIENKAIQIWMQKIQDLAYDAEDVLDEFGYELLRRKVESRSQRKKVSSFFSSCNPILFRYKMAHKLKNITDELEKIRTESSGLGLVHIRYVENRIEETDSFLENCEIVGRNDEVSTILNMISQSSSSTCVIPIVGMPGLGKTTLARLLSKKVEENKLFDERMWVCVSNSFDERIILRGMLESLDKNSGGIDNIDAVLKYIRENLKNKSFFLVLDDVWNEESYKWDNFMNRLSKINENRKNCVIITTRNEQVASISETIPMERYYPTKLSDDECWIIIKEKVFGKSFENIPRDLTDVGRDIARKCAGLPLLARVLGGTMRSRKTSADWASIRDSQVWNTLKENNDIFPVLKLSFDRLSSSSLKQCFAYCAIFPEDYVIEKSKLIRLWIAQGYVHHDHERNITVDDAGEKYFKILLGNSLFQDVVKDKFENIISCKMHDAVHGLAEFVSRSEIWMSNSISRSNICNTRHIRLKSEENILIKLEETGRQKLRSLFSDVQVDNNTLRGLNRMRVLDIDSSGSTVSSATFVELKHLRYLDISNNTISIGPRSITKLCNLQTLRFMNCYSTPTFPFQGVEHLINLKHIIFNDPDLTPSYIGKLTCLQTLSMFRVETKKGHGIEELGSLKQLKGKLKLQNLENVKGKSNACEADIRGKLKLQNLTYEWFQVRNDSKDVLEGLEPHQHLIRLKISNFGGENFSSWLSDHHLLGRLRRLKLNNCRNCIELPTLGEMSCLENLVMFNIDNVKLIGIEFYTRVDLAGAVNGGITLFPALKKLEVYGMSKLEEWVEPLEEGITTFPSLEFLSVRECNNLTRIPVIRSKSLRELVITGCSKLMSIPVIQSKSLRKLYIYECPKLTSLTVSHLSSLEELIIEGCENLINWEGVNGSVLVKFWIRSSRICILPTGLQFSNSLKYFSIFSLPNLTMVPENLGDITGLVEFKIKDCEALTNIPTQLRSSESLKVLHIRDCERLENIPENMGEMSSLEELLIMNCPKVIGLVNIPIYHQRLKSLTIGDFTKMEKFPNLDDRVNSSVQFLKLIGWHGLRSIPYLQHFTHMRELYIYSFAELEVLPEWLGNLSSLVKLQISNCIILRSLPQSMMLLTNLKELYVYGCPILDDFNTYPFYHIRAIHINGTQRFPI